MPTSNYTNPHIHTDLVRRYGGSRTVQKKLNNDFVYVLWEIFLVLSMIMSDLIAFYVIASPSKHAYLHTNSEYVSAIIL